MDGHGRRGANVSGPHQAMTRGRHSVSLDGGNGVTVSANDGVSPYNSTVGIRFNTDGTVETGSRINGAAIAWVNGGVWIDPLYVADSSFSVRFTNFDGSGGGDWTSEAAADDVWVNLSGQLTWLFTSTILGTDSFSVDWEVRKTAGAPPATASVGQTFSIENSA